MVERIYQIVWTKRSQLHLRAAYNYISEDSPQNALKVVEDIVAAVNMPFPIQNFIIPTNTRLITMASTVPLKTPL